MKANEAPEKIYLVPFGKPIIEPLPQEGSLADTIWSSKPYANSNAGNIEYTRTDAFIEKASCYLNSKLYDWVRVEHPNSSASLELIIKQDFIEDFKSYMKGE